MNADEIEPTRLRDLLHECVASDAAHQAARLREAVTMLGHADLDGAVEAMLACEAYESAAMTILGDRGFLVSRASTGTCLASVQLNDGEDITAEGATLALALLAAYLAALLAEVIAARPQTAAQDGTTARLH